MKKIVLSILILLAVQLAEAQENIPREVTPQVLQKITAEVEKLVPAYKQRLAKQELSADQVEFSVDTFRIEQIAAKRLDIDYSTAGMNQTTDELTASYDKLMNRYYNKLLKILKPEDKKTLIAAQKAWLAFRDAENNLIGVMTKEEYSGGGTIQSIIANGSYSDLVVKRTIAIFNYYDGVIKSN